MKTVIFWFRNDLRLHDQPALQAALASGARYLLPVACLAAPAETTAWGWERASAPRRAWLHGALRDLDRQLTALGCPLLVCDGDPASVLPALAAAVGAAELYCEEIAAPEEQQQVTTLRAALRPAGVALHTTWHSSLLDPQYLPWTPDRLPASYTPFRQAVERAAHLATSATSTTSTPSATRAAATAPLAAPSALVPAPLPAPDALLPWPPAATATDASWPGYRASPLRSARRAMRCWPIRVHRCPPARPAWKAARPLRWRTCTSICSGACPTATSAPATSYTAWIFPASARRGWPMVRCRRGASWPRCARTRRSTAPAKAATGYGSNCCGATTSACCTCSMARRCTANAACLRAARRPPAPPRTHARPAWSAGATAQPASRWWTPPCASCCTRAT